ncbi:hypothetical protein VitviT2T_030501 [Vitis vinifera]|uniref:F-box domain-containing protein n=1 Tax=Vitis vinifera TaxID=29760 RepID=A0ABY9E059_VITVI|nr:hypothetical protein VitviT2T_030501 [Vitis vinifera]
MHRVHHLRKCLEVKKRKESDKRIHRGFHLSIVFWSSMAEIEKNPKKMTNMSERLDERDLHNILNELPMKDAVRAGFLSRKWRNQWKYLANVVFKQSTGKEIESLTHFISLHRGNKIKKFHVEFKYRPNKEDQVNEWMSFAITKEVEDLKLDFDMKGDNDPLYILPPFIFNCESLVSLSLKGCVLELPDSIYLPNLHTLSLTRMEIGSRNGMTIRKITSRAPLLERMSLVNCSRFRNFNIDASESPNLKELAIIETKVDLARSTGMDICAPSVEKLVFLYASPRREYHVKDVSNCLEFTFALSDQPHEYLWKEVGEELLSLRYHVVLLNLLPHFQHVRVLRICNWCVQVSASFKTFYHSFFCRISSTIQTFIHKLYVFCRVFIKLRSMIRRGAGYPSLVPTWK